MIHKEMADIPFTRIGFGKAFGLCYDWRRIWIQWPRLGNHEELEISSLTLWSKTR